MSQQSGSSMSGRRPYADPRGRVRTSMTGHDVPRAANPLPYFGRPVTYEPEPAISVKMQYVLGGLSPFATIAILWAAYAVMHFIGLPDAITGFTIWAGFLAIVFSLFYVCMNSNPFMLGALTVILAIPLLMFGLCGIVLVGGAVGALR